MIQLRAKRFPSGAFLDLCDAAVALAQPYKADIIVNDRLDLALMSGAAGVHLGQDDLSPAAARQLLGPGAIVGYSTHTIDQVDKATLEPASYIAIGPVFGTTTKETGLRRGRSRARLCRVRARERAACRGDRWNNAPTRALGHRRRRLGRGRYQRSAHHQRSAGARPGVSSERSHNFAYSHPLVIRDSRLAIRD
mgnify:CR=1 FL=1